MFHRIVLDRMIHRTRTRSEAFSVDSRALHPSLFSSPVSYLVVPSVEEETPGKPEPSTERDRESGTCICMCVCMCVCVCVYSVILKVV